MNIATIILFTVTEFCHRFCCHNTGSELLIEYRHTSKAKLIMLCA